MESDNTVLLYRSAELEPNHRRDIVDNWWNHTIYIYPWYTENWGSVLTFHWQEIDPKFKASVSVHGSYEKKIDSALVIQATIDFSFNISDGGDIGQTDVYYWHPQNTIYNTGGLSFKFQ